MLELAPLDKSNPLPLYHQLKMVLLREIQKETHPCGVPLPTEERIAAMCGVSRTTVRQAINELVKEGWLCRRKAKGCFISDNHEKRSIAEYPEKYGVAVHWRGKELQTELLDFSIAPPQAADSASRPSGKTSDMTSCTIKRKCCDGRPAALFRIYQSWEHGLFPRISRVRHILRTIEAGAEDMQMLNLSRSEPVQEVLSIAFNHRGCVVEYAIAHYLGSMCRVEAANLG